MNNIDKPLIIQSTILVMLFILIPHFIHMPLGISLLLVAFLLTRLYIAHYQKSLPHKSILTLMVIVALIFVYSFHGGFKGVDVAVSLFILLLTLKLFESRNQRDLLFVVLLNYFLIATNFFFNQSISMLVHLLISVWGITLLLIAMHTDHGMKNIKPKINIANRMLLQATPIAIALFIIFPRLPAPIWGLPDNSAVSGLTDTLSPGDIGQLRQSAETAFRVDFIDPDNLRADYYWRGLVLNNFDGKTWNQQRVPYLERLDPNAFPNADPSIEYQITLEAHQKPWLFTLDRPTTLIQNSQMSTELIATYARKNQKVEQRLSYTALSSPLTHYKTQLQNWERTLYLQIPNNNLQTRRWAQIQRTQYTSDEAFIRGILHHIYSKPYEYTLTPPTIEHANFVDAFWLGTQQGFCSHYASAFAYILRTVGIPARLVAGYQGGTINSIGHYLIVRQSEAHVWVEVWFNGAWQRIDPTAAIHPSRIAPNLANENRSRQALSINQLPSLPIPDKLSNIDWLLMQYDNINHKWNNWVVGYNQKVQLNFLSWLGIKNFTSNWLFYLIGLVGSIIIILLIKLIITTQRHADPVSFHYQRLLKKLAKLGLEKHDHEGPTTYLQRLSLHLPRHKVKLNRILQLYINLKLKSVTTTDKAVKSFAKEISQLNISKSDVHK